MDCRRKLGRNGCLLAQIAVGQLKPPSSLDFERWPNVYRGVLEQKQWIGFGFDLGAVSLTEPSSTFLYIAMRTAK
jgi:hypothetical protein